MDKPKTGILAGIRKYGKNYLYAMIVAALMAVVGNIATLLGPNQLSRITNLISKGLRGSIDLQAIGQIVLVLAIIYAVGAIMSYGQGYIMATVSQAFTRDLRNNVSHKINRLPLTYFDEHDEGGHLIASHERFGHFWTVAESKLGNVDFIGCFNRRVDYHDDLY